MHCWFGHSVLVIGNLSGSTASIHCGDSQFVVRYGILTHKVPFVLLLVCFYSPTITVAIMVSVVVQAILCYALETVPLLYLVVSSWSALSLILVACCEQTVAVFLLLTYTVSSLLLLGLTQIRQNSALLLTMFT